MSGNVRYPRGAPLGLSTDEVARGYVLLCQAVATTDVVVEAREIRRVTDVEGEEPAVPASNACSVSRPT